MVLLLSLPNEINFTTCENISVVVVAVVVVIVSVLFSFLQNPLTIYPLFTDIFICLIVLIYFILDFCVMKRMKM